MKKISVLLFCMFLSCSLFSQDKDSLLRQINQIKKDTGRYLYGLSTLPGEPDRQVSKEEARKELNQQIESYLNTEDFVYLKKIPEELVSDFSCQIRPDCYRTIVYIEKSRIREAEKELAEQLNDNSRTEAIQELVNGILSAKKLDEVLNLIATSSLTAEIKTGQRINNETQAYANDGLLVFFEPRSKRIQEVMTPMDTSYGRKNAQTGAPAQPMRYKNSPLWIYIEGLKNIFGL